VLMASPRLLHEEPEWVARLLVAVNRGVIDMIREPDAALAALGRVAPGLDSDAERVRLQATLALEMSNELPNGARQPSVGDVDPARLVRGIALMVQGSGLPRTPAATDVFTWAHLPPADARARP